MLSIVTYLFVKIMLYVSINALILQMTKFRCEGINWPDTTDGKNEKSKTFDLEHVCAFHPTVLQA